MVWRKVHGSPVEYASLFSSKNSTGQARCKVKKGEKLIKQNMLESLNFFGHGFHGFHGLNI